MLVSEYYMIRTKVGINTVWSGKTEKEQRAQSQKVREDPKESDI